MRLVRARVVPYRLPLTRPWTTARNRVTARKGFLVGIQDSNQRWGWGDAAPPLSAGATDLRRLHATLRTATHHVLQRPADSAYADTLPATPRHAVTQALFDLEAQAAGEPLHRLLARREGLATSPARRIRVNATLTRGSPSDTVQRALAARRQGYATIKLKLSAQEDGAALVARVRRAVGPRVHLRLDPNGAWSAAFARRQLAALAPMNIEYVEQPVGANRWQDLVSLARASPVPIAPDESIQDLRTARRAIESNAFGTVVVKPGAVGGLDRAATIVRIARDAHVRIVVTDRLDSAIGRAGALHVAALLGPNPPTCGLASGTWFGQDVAEAPRPDAGARLRVPHRPGLGLRPRLEGN